MENNNEEKLILAKLNDKIKKLEQQIVRIVEG